MIKVNNMIKIGDKISMEVSGDIADIKNNDIISTDKGVFKVISIAMVCNKKSVASDSLEILAIQENILN